MTADSWDIGSGGMAKAYPNGSAGKRAWILVALVGIAFSAACSPASSVGDPDSSERVIQWLAENHKRVGLVARYLDDSETPLALNRNQLFPLASVRKVLLLGAYADRVEQGDLQPEERVSLAEVKRWHWPGTDGGAHERAVREWRAAGNETFVTLADLARGMIRWSDNVSADALLERVGIDEAVRFAENHHMAKQEPPVYSLGQFVAWASIDEQRWLEASAVEHARMSRELATSVANPSALDDRLQDARLRVLARASPRGSPQDWAALLSDIVMARRFGTVAHRVVKRVMEWPMDEVAGAKHAFEALGLKDGSMPGVRTLALYAVPKDGVPFVGVLFVKDLENPVEDALVEELGLDRFLLELSVDRRLYVSTARRLAGEVVAK